MSDLPPTHNPPSYSPPDETLFSNYDVSIPLDEILPGYSAINQSSSGSGPVSRPGRRPTTRPPPKEFEYKVEGGKGSPIAILMVIADALYSKNIPTYIGASPIKGNVRLRSDKVDGVQAIIISVRWDNSNLLLKLIWIMADHQFSFDCPFRCNLN